MANEETEQDGNLSTGTNRNKSKLAEWATEILLLLIFGPILVYFAAFYDSREDELKRYHREMVALEEALVQSLKDGSEVLVAGSAVQALPAKDSNTSNCTDDQKAKLKEQEKAEKETGRNFAQVSYSRFADLALEPYLPCRIKWETESGRLHLNFELDRPVVMLGGSTAPTQIKTDEPIHRVDYRSRYSGDVDLHLRLEELTEDTTFDALLVANAKGELILKLGRSAPLFSTLPVLATPGWDAAIESEPKDRELAQRPFIPTGIRQVEREVAGTHYTLFPREITLTPTPLLGGSTSCRSDEPGGETLRLRVVGLVESRRLTLIALRPPEAFYWFFFLSYLLAFFYVIQDALKKRRAVKWKYVRITLTTFFGLCAGILTAMMLAILGLNFWKDSQLKKNADGAIATITTQTSEIFTNAQTSTPLEDIEGFWLFTRTGEDYQLTLNQNACREQRRRFSHGIEDFLVDSNSTRHSTVSRKDGRRITVVKRPSAQDTSAAEVARVHLEAFKSANYDPGFGLAMVDVYDSGGNWKVLHDSETKLPINSNFLPDFSEAGCLRILLSNSGGFCTGDLRGRPARLYLVRLGEDFKNWKRQGSLALIAYAYKRPHDLSLEGATISSLTIGLAIGTLLVLCGCWLVSTEPAWLTRAAGWLSKVRIFKDSVSGELACQVLCLTIALILGFALFSWSWGNESNLYFTTNLQNSPSKASAIYGSFRPANDRQIELNVRLASTALVSDKSRVDWLPPNLAWRLWLLPFLGLVGTLLALLAFLYPIPVTVPEQADSADSQNKNRWKVAFAFSFLGLAAALLLLIYGQELASAVIAACGALSTKYNEILDLFGLGGDNDKSKDKDGKKSEGPKKVKVG